MRNWSNNPEETKRRMRRSARRAWRNATPERRKAAGHNRGKTLSPEHADKIRQAQLRSWTKERREKAAKITRRNWRNEEYRTKVLESTRQSWSQERREAVSQRTKEFWQNEKARGHIVRLARERWKDGSFKKSTSRAMKEGWRKSPEAKAKISASVKSNWNNPEFRNNITYKNQEKAIEQWSDPKFRKRFARMARTPAHRQKISEGLLLNSRGPVRESTLEGGVVNWARAQGILVFKADPKYCVGAPDRIFMIPGGKPILIEFKKPGYAATPTRIQTFVINQLRKAGYDVRVECNKENCIAAITQAMEAARRAAKGR